MTPLPRLTRRRAGLFALAAVQAAGLGTGLGVLSACGSILPKPPALPTLFTLDDGDATAPPAAPPPASATRPRTLLVSAPRAAPGFDTEHMVYVRRALQVEAFAQNQWVAPPAQMLAPLMVRALQRSGAFQAVQMAPSATASELRLDTDLIRLQQDFTASPSQVRVTLRAVLIDPATRRVLAWRELDRSVPAPSDDPYGGVQAAHRAVRELMADLVLFCVKAMGN